MHFLLAYVTRVTYTLGTLESCAWEAAVIAEPPAPVGPPPHRPRNARCVRAEVSGRHDDQLGRHCQRLQTQQSDTLAGFGDWCPMVKLSNCILLRANAFEKIARNASMFTRVEPRIFSSREVRPLSLLLPPPP